ncbi:hypothetical protein D3C84_681990 [compost metagenome]
MPKASRSSSVASSTICSTTTVGNCGKKTLIRATELLALACCARYKDSNNERFLFCTARAISLRSSTAR